MTRSAIAKATACALGITIALAGPGIRASSAQQQTNSGVGIGPSQQQAQPQEPAPPPAGPPHLFGDWDGLRTDLGNFGINLNLDYTTEFAGNVAGGLRQGFDYAHQIGLQLDVDWEKLADIPGFSTHMVVVNRAGRNLSSDYIGDNVLQAQEIFGAGFRYGGARCLVLRRREVV